MRRTPSLAAGAILAVLACLALVDGPRGGAGTTTRVRVIVQASDLRAAEALIRRAGGTPGRRLEGIHALAALVPEGALADLAGEPGVQAVTRDHRISGTLDRTAAAIGSRYVVDNLGFDGTGVGVAIIDSGVTRAHDDLAGGRIVHFADFVESGSQLHDGYGHGTHVAGIIAGSGYDSHGARRGVAPGAHLIILRALDEQGDGYISDAIAALDYAIELRQAYNIRVINLSVAASVRESYATDPLALAASRAVDAGIVVVTAAGNLGRSARGERQHAGITSPGNAPWVLTVGAVSGNGTAERTDDSVAAFSSRGPTSIDHVTKPDLVAPGVGIESLADPGSTLFNMYPDARLWGTIETTAEPYLRLSGTSMAAPVVAGTVALMLQAAPTLTPDAVKRILRSTAEPHIAYTANEQGAGFLDARGAVELARNVEGTPGAAQPAGRDAARVGANTSTGCDPAGAECGSAFGACAEVSACSGRPAARQTNGAAASGAFPGTTRRGGARPLPSRGTPTDGLRTGII